MGIKIEVGVLDCFKLATRLHDKREIFAALGTELLKEIYANFAAGGIWTKWQPLRPNTKAGRRAGASSRPLQASGALRASFRMEATANMVRVGSPLKIAKYHQEGRKGPWTIRPKRALALAFPVAFQTYGAGGKIIQGGRVGSGAKFKSYGHKKRSKKFLERGNFAVVKSVRHPGYPARPMLPPERVAYTKAIEVLTAMLYRS